MRSKVLFGLSVLGLLLSLSGCMSPPGPSPSSHCLLPLGEGTAPDVLECADVRALLSRLEGEGYTPLLEAISTEEFLGMEFTFIPLSKEESPEGGADRGALPPPGKTKPQGNGSDDDPMSPSSSPKIALPLESMAYVVHWAGGTIGVLPVEDGRFRVLYADGERSYRTVLTPGSLLKQLRENDRFVTFERWLLEEHPLRRSASSPLRLYVSRAFLDESLGVVYVILTLRETTPRGPYDYRTVSEDEDLKPLREYLVLAKAIGEINGEVIIDPDSIWLLPRGSGEEEDPWSAGIPRREVHLDETKIVNLTVPPQLHVIHGFGEAPGELGGLRPFGFVVMRDPMAGRYRSLPMPSPSDQGDRTVTPPRKPPAGKIYFGTELYIWGLADWGPENLVLRFEPAAELTLVAYNEIADSNTAVLALKQTDEPVVLLAGFGETSLEEAEHLYRQAKGSLKNVYKRPTNRELLEGMSQGFDIVMDTWGLDPDAVVRWLLQLGHAQEEGRFEEAYRELLPQLSGLLEYLKLVHGQEGEGAREVIRHLSRHVYSLALDLGYRGVGPAADLQPRAAFLSVFEAAKAFLMFLKDWVLPLFGAIEVAETIKHWIADPDALARGYDVDTAIPVLEEALRRVALKYYRNVGLLPEEAESKARAFAAMAVSITGDWEHIEGFGTTPGRAVLNRLFILLGLRAYFTLEGYMELVEKIDRMHYRGKWTIAGLIPAEHEGYMPAVVYYKYLHYEPAWQGFPPEFDDYVIAAVRHLQLKDIVPFVVEPDAALEAVARWAVRVFEALPEVERELEGRRGGDVVDLHVAFFILEHKIFIELAKDLASSPEELVGRIGDLESDGPPKTVYLIWEEEVDWFVCRRVLKYVRVGDPGLDLEAERELVKQLAGYAGLEEVCVVEYDPIFDSERNPSYGDPEPDPYAMAMMLAGEIEEAAGEDIWDGDPDDPPMPMAEGS